MVSIYVDSREIMASGIPAELQALGVEIKVGNLETGDYVISGNCVVERKTAPDFISSLLDGRFTNQAGKMLLNFKRVIYIVEGDIFATRSAIQEEALIGALSYLSVILGCSVIHYRTPKKAAKMIRRMATHAQAGLSCDVAFRRGKTTPGKGEALFSIEGYAGVGPSTAKKILTHFRSSFAFTNATVEQLMAVKGIGAVKARRIFDAIHYELPEGETVNDSESLFVDGSPSEPIA